MKVDTQEQLDELYRTTNNIIATERDKAGNIVMFKYIKFYGTSRAGKREIVVSLKKGKKNRGQKVYLPEQDFFNQLADNYVELTDIKARDGKIIQYKHDGIKYVTDPPQGVSTFDLFDYRKFLRITWQRFWDDDTLLRNGYFGGLIGSNIDNITTCRAGSILAGLHYDIYDIDINHCYPFCYNYPLPCGRFYNLAEWCKLDPKPSTHICFYHIRIKTIKNKFGLYVPLPPYVEYRDFDFLVGRNAYEMIVSEYRLFLIDRIYGKFAYEIIDEFYCASKIYLGIVNFYNEQMAIIEDMKKRGEYTADRKLACNALNGMFGMRDETKNIIELDKRNNDIFGEIFVMKYGETEWKKANNYILIPMCVSDIAAIRLFYMLTHRYVRRLSWNTDGAVIALLPYIEPQDSRENGAVKSKLIREPEFYSTSVLYNRPLIFDRSTKEVFNTKSITFDGDNFIWEQEEKINTRKGFVHHVNYSVLPVEDYNPVDLRYSEVLIKLNDNDNYRKALRNKLFREQSEIEAHRLLCPYDAQYNFIRHKPVNDEEYDKYIKFYRNFLKFA